MKQEQILRRDFSFERAVKDESRREVELSWASETPCERSFGYEVLGLAPGEVDLSRLNSRSCPLLWNHDTNELIGTVTKAWLAGNKARALVRFGHSAKAREVWQDVQDGIVSTVSVGYRVDHMEPTDEQIDGAKCFRVTKWTPLELTICPCPLDSTVGIGRSIGRSAIEEIRHMETRENQTHVEISAIARHLDGKINGIGELASAAILGNWSVEQFRGEAMKKLPNCNPISVAPPLADIKPKEWANYSLGRAIRGKVNDKLEGFEREIDRELAIKTGRTAEGFWAPGEAFLKRNYVAGTNTLGGFVVNTVTDGSQFVELLRNRARVVDLGARVINLNNPIQIPRMQAGGTANWLNGETAASTLSAGNFTQLTLTPKGCGVLQQYSKQLLFESDPSVDMIIRDDINASLAILVDLAALHGSGASGQPTGIAQTTGIKTVALATDGQALGNSTAYPALVSLTTLIATDNADTENMGYLVNPSHRGALQTTVKFANTGFSVWEPGNRINGYRAEVTNQIAQNLTTGTASTICSCIFFANWNDLIIAQFNGGATDLVVDPYTSAERGIVRIAARRWIDLGPRHASSFAILGGIR